MQLQHIEKKDVCFAALGTCQKILQKSRFQVGVHSPPTVHRRDGCSMNFYHATAKPSGKGLTVTCSAADFPLRSRATCCFEPDGDSVIDLSPSSLVLANSSPTVVTIVRPGVMQISLRCSEQLLSTAFLLCRCPPFLTLAVWNCAVCLSCSANVPRFSPERAVNRCCKVSLSASAVVLAWRAPS